MILFLKLLLAHFICDFLLQPKSWVNSKEKHKLKSITFYIHILLNGCIPLLLLLWDWNYWSLAVLIMLSHGIIDALKLYAQRENNKTHWFLTDQVLHMISIIILWCIWSKPNINLTEWSVNTGLWVYLTAILFLTVVSGIIIQVVMSNWSKSIN
jgi:hypothetical protein